MANQIAEISMENKQFGSGKASNFVSMMGIAGTSAGIGAYAFYQYLLKNPTVAAKILAKGSIGVASKFLGSGLSLAGGKCRQLPHGVSMLGSGKIKKDRYSVYYGYYPKTASGLKKCDLMLKGKKVISRKKSEIGKRLRMEGKGIYKK